MTDINAKKRKESHIKKEKSKELVKVDPLVDEFGNEIPQ